MEDRGINHAHAGLVNDLADFRLVLLPARGAHYHIDAQRRQAMNVFHHGVGGGEVDANVDALELLPRNPAAVGVRVDVHHQAHFKVALRRQERQRFAHLPIT